MKNAKPRKTVFVIDDHPMTTYGVVQLINGEPDMMVCGQASDAREAMGALAALKTDLVLADITMPGRSGLDLIKDLQALHPTLPVLIMSMHDETIYAERVLRAGGRGYIMKSEGGGKLLEAIRHVLSGQVYLSQKVSASILDGLTRRRGKGVSEVHPSSLSDREFEVFQLLGQGFSTRDIAQRLGLSPKTVGVHRLHIKDKLHLQSGSELTGFAVRWAATQQLV